MVEVQGKALASKGIFGDINVSNGRPLSDVEALPNEPQPNDNNESCSAAEAGEAELTKLPSSGIVGLEAGLSTSKSEEEPSAGPSPYAPAADPQRPGKPACAIIKKTLPVSSGIFAGNVAFVSQRNPYKKIKNGQ